MSRRHPIRLARSARIRLLCYLNTRFEKKVNYDIDTVRFYYDYHWNAMPLEVVKWICSFIDANPGYWDIFDSAFMCEESFFTTTIKLGPYADRIVMNDNTSRSLTYTGETINNHPIVLRMSDIEDIENSGLFFARKFDDVVDSDVIDYFRRKVKNGDKSKNMSR